MRPARRVLLGCLLIAAGARPGRAEIAALGTEFEVNTYTTGNQYRSSVALTSPAGDFVVVWASHGQDGDSYGYGIFGQRFARNGARHGTEFQVNTYTTSYQINTRIGSDDAGTFVVVWSSLGQDGDNYGAFGQRFASDGTRLGTEFQVNTYTTGRQANAAVAFDQTGAFVIVWDSSVQDAGTKGVFGQRFTSSGDRRGTEFQVNTYTTGVQDYPSIASDPAGNFVVVWQSAPQRSVFGQRFASDGARVGTEFQVNDLTSFTSYVGAVAADRAGDFVVTWTDTGLDGDFDGIFARRFTSAGVPLGTEFQVNTYTTDRQFGSDVSLDRAGDFVVAWTSNGQDGDGYGVFAQRYDSTGVRHGTEFQLNTYTTDAQGFFPPRVALDADGDFVVAWTSRDQDGSQSGIFARLFQDPCGNGTLDPGEQCDVGDRTPGNCCSPTCQLVPADCTTACEVCNTTRGCVAGPRPDCRHPAKAHQAALALTNKTPDKKDKLAFHWMKGAATTTADFGNPVATGDYTLCIFDRQSGADRLVLSSTAPKGSTWKATGTKGFRDKSKSGTPDGLTSVVLKSGGAGKATVLVDGKGANLKLPALGLGFPVSAQLQGPNACFGATYAGGTNKPSVFKAKGN